MRNRIQPDFTSWALRFSANVTLMNLSIGLQRLGIAELGFLNHDWFSRSSLPYSEDLPKVVADFVCTKNYRWSSSSLSSYTWGPSASSTGIKAPRKTHDTGKCKQLHLQILSSMNRPLSGSGNRCQRKEAAASLTAKPTIPPSSARFTITTACTKLQAQKTCLPISSGGNFSLQPSDTRVLNEQSQQKKSCIPPNGL